VGEKERETWIAVCANKFLSMPTHIYIHGYGYINACTPMIFLLWSLCIYSHHALVADHCNTLQRTLQHTARETSPIGKSVHEKLFDEKWCREVRESVEWEQGPLHTIHMISTHPHPACTSTFFAFTQKKGGNFCDQGRYGRARVCSRHCKDTSRYDCRQRSRCGVCLCACLRACVRACVRASFQMCRCK